MADFAISLNVFVWKSCTDQCEIYSLLEVVAWSLRYLQCWLAGGGGQGLGVCFSFLFFFHVELAAENTGWQPAKPAITQQGID